MKEARDWLCTCGHKLGRIEYPDGIANLVIGKVYIIGAAETICPMCEFVIRWDPNADALSHLISDRRTRREVLERRIKRIV